MTRATAGAASARGRTGLIGLQMAINPGSKPLVSPPALTEDGALAAQRRSCLTPQHIHLLHHQTSPSRAFLTLHSHTRVNVSFAIAVACAHRSQYLHLTATLLDKASIKGLGVSIFKVQAASCSRLRGRFNAPHVRGGGCSDGEAHPSRRDCSPWRIHRFDRRTRTARPGFEPQAC